MMHMLAKVLLMTAWCPANAPATYPAPLSPVFISYSTTADTGSLAEPAPVLLTEDMVKSYIAVRKEFSDYWKAHQALKDSATAAIKPVNLTVEGPGMPEHADTSMEFDYVKLAKKHPDIAAVFTKNHLTPAQFEPITIAVWKALFQVAASKTNGQPTTEDPASIGGKNITLVKGHVADFASVHMGYNSGPGGGAGGGGGGNDLNP